MKKFFICGLIIAAVSVITFSTSCLSTERPVDNIVKLLPENTDFMIKIGSLETVYKHFSVTENSVFGEPVKEIEDIKAELGFNPLVLSDLKSNGFDTGKDIGFMFNDFKFENEKPDFNFLVFIPVTDGKKVVDKIKTWVKKENSEAKFTLDGNITVIEEKNDNLYMFTKANYLFLGGNTNAKDAKAFVKTAEAGKTSLLKTKIYKDAAEKVSGKDLYTFINVPKVMPKVLEIIEAASKKTGNPGMPDIGKSMKYIKDYQGACLSVNLENNDLVINGAGNIVPDSKIHNVYKGVKFKKETVLGIKDNPAILISAALNAREYYNLLMETLAEEDIAKFKSGLQEIKTTVGIDVEKEVIENLAGSFNLGIYDGLSINIMNYNTVLSLSIKDEALMKKVIEKAISSMPPEKQQMAVKTKLGNLDVYAISIGGGMTQLYIGIKDKNLIVSVGKPMFEKAVSGKVSSGFTSAMADKKLAGALKKENTNIVYFNVSEIYSIFKTFATFANKFSKSSPDKPAVDPRVEKLINQFDYLLLSSWMEGNSAVTEMTFKTNFKEPFFKGLVNFSKELQKLKPAKKPDAPKKEEEDDNDDNDDKPGLPKKQS
ncbi:MAG: DUF3352 domain-containing protein [Desulfobacterales bacterium]|nr:DUF3352 domain-containing protein [Desulfobacterales bacterium]